MNSLRQNIFIFTLVTLLIYPSLTKASTFAALACSVLPDPEMRLQCENYATTYVTDMSVSSLSALVNEELSAVADTLQLMGFSQLSTIPDLASMTLTDVLNSTVLNVADLDLSAKLDELVNSKYSSDFLSGLTELETTELYESEFANLKTLLDFSGVGGAAATEDDITIYPTQVCYDPHFRELVVPCEEGYVPICYDPIFTQVVVPCEDSTSVITANNLDMGTNIISDTVSRTTTGQTYQADRETIDSIEIITSTMDASLSCMSWSFRGICVWLKWSWSGPKVLTSIKVENYVPELTFQAYDDGSKAPWNEARTLMNISGTDSNGVITRSLTSLMGATGAYKNSGGGKNAGNKSQGRSKTMFKMVDAFGNPAQLIFESTYGHLEAFCVPTTTNFEPYYNSNLDITNWRQHFGSEFLDFRSWIPGTYMLGSYANNNHYGSIYPRIGFAVSADEVKAAVLTTFRAAHFITRPNQLHVYQSIYRPHKKGLWVSNELDQNDGQTGKFQQLLPYKESSCRTFPLERNPDGKRRGETGSTVWNFWRKITCCKKRGSTLLFHT